MIFTLTFVLYTLLIVAVGLWTSRAPKGNEDYFLAGRRLGPWIASLSASASGESGWVTVGLVGMAYTSGLRAYWILPGCLLGFAFNWFVIAARLRKQSVELGAITIPDFFSLRFRERRPILRWLTVLVIVIAMWMYVAAQFAAAGKAFSAAFDGVPYGLGVGIGMVIVLAYTVIGGFRAACTTDFIQGIVMVGVLFGFPIYLLADLGGYGAIVATLEAQDPALVSFLPEVTGLALLGFLLGSGALGVNFGFVGAPHVLVRFMALRDPREARIGGVIAIVWGVMLFWGAVTIGIAIRALVLRDAGDTPWMLGMVQDQENALVLSARHLLPGVFSGMALAAVLSAICSTADSQLVVASSAVSHDLFGTLPGGERRRAWFNRASVLALGVAAALLVIDQDVTVYNFVLGYAWAVLGAGIGPQLILALLWKRASYAGSIAGMAVGFVVAIGWKELYEGDIEVYNLPLAFFAALVVNLGVSLAFPDSRRS